MAKLANPLGEDKDLPIGPECRFAAATGTTNFEVAIWTAIYPTVVEQVKVVLDAAVTGVDTNTASLVVNVYRGGTKLGALVTYDFTSGNDAAQFESLDLGALDPDYLSLQPGDVLTLAKTHGGTGLDLPAGVVIVDVREPHWNE